MVVELTSTTPNPAGNKTINLSGTETPSYIRCWVGPRTGTTETTNLVSFGAVDITNGNATWQSNYGDSTGFQTKNGVGASTTSSMLQHWARVTGTLTKIIDIEFVSAASGAFTVNVVTNNVNYTVYFEVFG